MSNLAEMVEPAAYRAWPAAESVEYDGWQLRYADGFSRRGNSVYPAQPSTLERAEKLSWCRDWYRTRGLDLVIRQTPASEAGLDDHLEQLGFRAEGRTCVMVADMSSLGGGAAAVANSPTAQWWETMARLWGIGADRQDAWRGIINRIDSPAGFGLVDGGGVPIGAGLAVAVGEWLGLFEVIVAVEHRRRGVGRDLTRSLLAWGRRQGAERAFLQVVEDNVEAVALYEQLGFRHAYTYWYRRDPSQ